MAALTVIETLILKNKVIAAGATGALIFQNRRVPQTSGVMQVNAMWDEWLHEYDLSMVPLRRADWQYLQTLHRLTRGGAYGFLMVDPTDYQAVSTSADSSSSGVVVALGSNNYQLYKRYRDTASTLTDDRKITRPIVAGSVVMVSGTPITLGVDYTSNASNGIINIPSGPAAANVTWTGRFYVPVHFQSDRIDWSMVVSGQDPDQRYMTGPSVVLQEIRE